ncbi:MAG: manganese efflux pump [Lentisphaerae bacterium]|jgi:putative Mn2+ efflux pump MntP|nr:manganese efflux pump MntP family protein [Victivallaceae bacterium]MDD3117019.1 manganese efflux pump MntP family protein [Victivallaceae bacterium]MDD3702909.1 manganese efflux pump MntP family protein [Victivallaceae bacterium]MDD5662862.1 manganese efflux pump MntP family protein [Victivallaceae bacterium]NLK84101.1 manganese efflux pump [Lentisphaerota bacterium]
MVYYFELVLLSCGLAMDALAAAMVMGVNWRERFTARQIALAAFLFGFFQAAMPLIGWFGSRGLGEWVHDFGPYIACALLWLIAIKMLLDSHCQNKLPSFSLRELFILALATSIDALLVGVSFACLKYRSITTEVLFIGIITMIITAFGCVAGKISGKMFCRYFERIGALVLIGIGIKFLFAE